MPVIRHFRILDNRLDVLIIISKSFYSNELHNIPTTSYFTHADIILLTLTVKVFPGATTITCVLIK